MRQEEIVQHYREKREEIRSRLDEFRDLRDADDSRWFRELCFVLMTSRTDARDAWEAALRLDRHGLLEDGSEERIGQVLEQEDVSYGLEKASYIVENRRELSQPTLENPSTSLRIKERLDLDDLESARNWLASNMAGIGMKGASHFLRNIGYGDGFAILSGHVLKEMARLGYLDDSSPPEGRDEYLEKEESFRQLSEDTGIEVQALDLAIWSMETGEVFR